MNRTWTGLVNVAVALALVVGCSHKNAVIGNSMVIKPGVITLSAGWVKEKGSRYDLGLNLHNDSTGEIVVASNEAHCFRGATEGILKNMEHGEVELGAGKSKSVTAHCDFGSAKPTGNFRIRFDNVYASNAGTRGKVLVKDVNMEIGEKK